MVTLILSRPDPQDLELENILNDAESGLDSTWRCDEILSLRLRLAVLEGRLDPAKIRFRPGGFMKLASNWRNIRVRLRYWYPYRLTLKSNPAIYAWLFWNFSFDKRVK